MQLTQFIQRSLILGSEVRTLEQAIEMMVQRLSETHLAADKAPEILQAVLRREQLSSTAIGRGMAIPHAGRLPIDRVLSIVAVSRFGIEGHSIDAEPVHVVFLLLLPAPNSPVEHRLYRPETEALWRFLRNEEQYSRLRGAQSESEIDDIIRHADESYSFQETV